MAQLQASKCRDKLPKQHSRWHSPGLIWREGKDFSTSSSDSRQPRYGRNRDSTHEDGNSSSSWRNKDASSSNSGWQGKDSVDRMRSSGRTAGRSGFRDRDAGSGGYPQRQDRWQGEGRRNYREKEQGDRQDNAGGSRWQSGSRNGSSRDSRYNQDRQYSSRDSRSNQDRNNRGTYDTTEAVDADDAERGDWEEEDEGEVGGQRGRSWDRGVRDGAGHQDVRRSELQGEALYGVFPILNALQAKRRSVIHTLFVLSTLDLSARKDAASVQAALSAAEAAGVAVQKVSRHELNLLSNDRPHQGLVLDCAPLANQPLDVIPDAASVHQPGAAPPVWLALDEVMDPQNLGAILRSAWCLGAAGLLVSARNCAPLSPAVSKASAGALELAPVHSCKNMQRTLQDAAAKGWSVLGAAGETGAVDSASLPVTQPTILVMGNEGYGLRTNVRRACTGLVKVHMQQGFVTPAAAATAAGSTGSGTPRRSQAQGGVDSLNVSVATGILLHDLLTAARRNAAAPAAAGTS